MLLLPISDQHQGDTEPTGEALIWKEVSMKEAGVQSISHGPRALPHLPITQGCGAVLLESEPTFWAYLICEWNHPRDCWAARTKRPLLRASSGCQLLMGRTCSRAQDSLAMLLTAAWHLQGNNVLQVCSASSSSCPSSHLHLYRCDCKGKVHFSKLWPTFQKLIGLYRKA